MNQEPQQLRAGMPKKHSFLGRWLLNLPITQKLSLIVLMMTVIIAGSLGSLWFGMETLSALRAYVGGEGLWSKAQKDGVYHLRKYASSHKEEDYQDFLLSSVVQLGAKEARKEIAKESPNYERLRQGLLQGRNHPEDIPGLITLMRRFYWVDYIEQAMHYWTEADILMDEVRDLGGELHRTISAGNASQARIDAILDQLEDLNHQISTLSDQFSYTIGVVSRWAKDILLKSMIWLTLVIGVIGLAITIFISRTISRGIHQIQDATLRFSEGRWEERIYIDSRDEIGGLARAFNEMGRKLEAAERIKSDFLANVSHELRTPLTLTLAPVESLLAEEFGSLTIQQQRMLEMAHNNSVRLLQMVNGLLDFSKLEAGKIQVKREPTPIIALSQSILSDFEPLILQKKLELIKVFSSESVILIDRYLYERILFNLLSNAIKFTPIGGKISISVSVNASDNRLQVSVADTGIGISQDNLAQLFQRFRQLEGAATRRFEGTGLGLSLVKEFSLLLGGDVEVYSERDQGSRFTVTCTAPVVSEITTEAVSRDSKHSLVQKYDMLPVAASPTGDAAGRVLPRLLIAEDNVELAAYMATLLRTLCQVQIAKDGVEALALTRKWQPDLVVSDVMMPRKDGFTLCRDIKADPETALIPVVLLTALTHRDALLQGWEAGADEYLYKPFHPKELVARVKSLLSSVEERKRADKLAYLNRVKTEFTSMVSHELRTPLSAIKEAIQLVIDGIDGPITGEQQETLGIAKKNVDRLTRLINNVLDITKIESGKMELAHARVNMNLLVSEVYDFMKLAVEKKNLTFLLHLPPEPIITWCDPDKIRQVLINLIDNAIKFTEPGGQIAMSLSLAANHEIEIAVSDTGIGIRKADQTKVFEMFAQAADIGTRRAGGTGIGLTLCRELLKLHGGKISIDSEYGKGSRFTVFLPYMYLQAKPPLAVA